MIDYPIENRTKQNLWFDVDGKRQTVYIHTDDGIYEPDKDVLIEPGESVILEFGMECWGFKIKDKDGKIDRDEK